MAKYSDLTLNSGEYIPQYAGAPLAEIQQTGNVLAGRHYQNIADMSALELALKQMKANALPGARSYIEQQVGQVHGELEKMAKSGAENSTAKVAALKNAFMGDEGLLRAGIQAKNAKELEQNRQAILAKGANPLYDQEGYNNLLQAPVTITDEEGNTIINPAYANDLNTQVAPELNPIEDYRSISDQIAADVVQKYAEFAELKNGKIVFQERADKGISKDKIMKDLKKELENAYKKTPSYEQGLKYKVKGRGTEKEALEGMIDYALLRVFNQEDVRTQPIGGSGKGDGSGDDASKAPIYNYNAGPSLQLTQETYGDTQASISEQKTLLDNLKKQNINDPVLKQENEAQIKALEGAIKTREHYVKNIESNAESTTDWNKLYSRFQTLIGKDKKLLAREGSYPKDMEAFKTQIRAGKMYDYILGPNATTTPAVKAFSNMLKEYKGKLESGHEKLKIATNYQPISASDKTLVTGINDLLTKSWRTTSTGFLTAIEGNQVTQQSLQDEFGSDYSLNRKEDQLYITDKVIGGKPLLHLEVFGKPKGEEGAQSQSVGTKAIIADNPAKVLDHMIQAGREMMQKGTPLDQEQGFKMVSHATILPQLARNGFDIHTTIEKTELPISIAGNKMVITPVEEGGKKTYKLTDEKGNYFGDVGGEEQLAEALYSLMIKASQL